MVSHTNMGWQQYEVATLGKKIKHEDPRSEELELICSVTGCGARFSKDHRMLLHVKMEHRDRSVAEQEVAWREAEREIAHTRISFASIECALCQAVLKSRSAMWSHVTKHHQLPWEEYLEAHGDPEVGGPDWRCKLCGVLLKHDKSRVSHHLKSSHNLGWREYLEQTRGVTCGEFQEADRPPGNNLEAYLVKKSISSSLHQDKEALLESQSHKKSV